jgi:CheY-like chemotaxis protein
MMVDDSEDIHGLSRLQLTQLSYRVIEAANGRSRPEGAGHEGCSALNLMDVTMHVLDGIEATRMIR